MIKIDKQSNKIDKLILDNKKQSEKIQKLLNYAKNTNDTLHEVKDENIELKDDINNLNENLTEVREVFYENLEKNVPTPENIYNLHEFTLLQYKNDLNIFKFMRGTKKYINNILNDNYNVIIKKVNANPINLFARLKEKIIKENKNEINNIKSNYKLTINEKKEIIKEIKNNPKIKIKYNTIEINNIQLEDLLNKIKDCDNEKYNVEIP